MTTTEALLPSKEEGESDDVRLEDINDRIYELINKIVLHTPTTATGAAVIVRAMVMDNSEWWAEGYDEGLTTMPEGRGRLFLESLCSFFGIVPVPQHERATKVQSVAL